MSQLPISVIILAHQDTALFRGAINSVSWANEILIYWTSKEAPPSWLKETAARVHKTSIDQSDFASYRNDATKLANEEIIFFLDSDEAVETDSEKALETLLNKSDWNGAFIKRVDVFHNREMKWGEVGDVHIRRIFRKVHFRFEREVHEIANVQGTTTDTQIVIKHFAHPDFSAFLTSILLYIQLEVKIRKINQEHVSTISLFAWPVGKFLYNYFLKLGILDGWRGLIYAICMSFHSFGLRATLYEQQ